MLVFLAPCRAGSFAVVGRSCLASFLVPFDVLVYDADVAGVSDVSPRANLVAYLAISVPGVGARAASAGF